MHAMVIAGTKDARDIINELYKANVKVTATVTTQYGKNLLEEDIEVNVGKLDKDAMIKFIAANEIACVVDASHPFAVEASQNALAACKEAKIHYLRFERESISTQNVNIIKVKSFEEAAKRAAEIYGNIFLTIGSNNLSCFVERIPDYKKRLFARVLPISSMLLKCEEAGLTADNIIAVKGPFSTQMNIEMMRHCNASVLVTKESGKTGGTFEKLSAASKLSIPVIMIERPEISYGKEVSTTKEVLEFVSSIKIKDHGLEN